MTRHLRARTGQRRDDGVVRITTDEVRFPGVELPPTLDDETASQPGTGLRPARDTGLALEGRLARQDRQRAKRRQRAAIVTVLVVLALAVLGMTWKYSSDRAASSQPLAAAPTQFAPQRVGVTPEERAAEHIKALNPLSSATPYFASYKRLKLRLPVSVDDLTEVGFHQASYGYALSMKTPLPNANLGDAEQDRSTHRKKDEQPTGTDAVLVGKVLRMWRNRPGKPDTAADVGAKVGSTVYSPVSGTVVKVKRFKLYGTYDDYELHIQPQGHPELDCVMLHVDSVACKPGDLVVGGVTPIARIRKLDKRIGPQLRTYTKNGGMHTHVQINDVTDPSYKGLEGAYSVPETNSAY
jgi:murein DD-endopeptidase MepM/ murein hydrolase activator NlpD